MTKLSVVTGTLNRLRWLKDCVASIRSACAGLESEIIIVDGGSHDGTLEWLRQQRDIITIEQGYPLGAVAAFNAGFFAAEGEYVASLNDDCIVVGDTFRMACAYLDAHPETGQVAIPWHDKGDIDIQVQHVEIGMQRINVIYANFGVTRRVAGDAVGWWGNWVHYGGDCELSFSLLDAGWFVDELVGGEILHFRVQDSTRRVCYHNQAFLDKWMTQDETKIIKMLAERKNGHARGIRDDRIPE